MVYIHFPSNLTEEEQMLQNKYQKLRKKKKALQLLKAPKPEPEKIQPLKRPTEAKDAKEVAKKLLKSGAISAIRVESKEKQGFKRSKNLERKFGTDKAQVSGYQPFQSTHPSDDEEKEKEGSPAAAAASSSPSTTPTSRPQLKKGLYESFVNSRERRRDRESRPERPKQGNTVYVYGFGVTEDILRNGFTPFGQILNISMEVDKNCGFITFEKMEHAEKAINEMNGTMSSGIQLKVSLARRQPSIESSAETQSSSNWSSIAQRDAFNAAESSLPFPSSQSNSQKGTHKDKRDLVAYSEDIF